jgi:amino acid permease
MVELFLETPFELKIMILVFAVFGFGLCWATKRDELKTFNDRYKVDQKWRGDDK